MTIPPPTPNSAPKNPAASPITTRRSTRLFLSVDRRSSFGGSRPSRSGPRSCSTSTGRSRRSSRGRRTRRCRRRRGASCERLAASTGSSPASRRAGARTRAASSASTASTIVGEHGLELEPEAEEWDGRLDAFFARVDWPAERQAADALVPLPHAPAAEQAAEELGAVAERAAVEGFRPRWGRKVLEIRPPVDADKGTAVRRLLEQHRLRRALYAGDDTTDLDAFRALDGLEVAVRVAVASAEAPAQLGSAADLVLGGTGSRRRAAARALMHVDEAVLAPAPRALRRAARARMGGRGLRARARDGDLQPAAAGTT